MAQTLPQDALRSPSAYPEAPGSIEMVETHASWVFLAGKRAYKLRKPVVFPFLDYGSAERRRHMCEEELRLGRRLAPRIYVGLRPLVVANGSWALGDPGAEGTEYVVEMRRFDQERTLATLLDRKTAGPELVRTIARRIAAFHRDAALAPPGRFDPEAVATTVSENFSTLLPYAPVLGARTLAAAHRFAAAFLHSRAGLIEQRAESGLVRDCHGDLRAEHVIVECGGVEVFDPVEFDPALREIDVSAELAFLVMDLFDAGAEELADLLVDEYEGAGGDHGGRPLVFFYAAYRALVRAKVACLRAGGLDPGAARSAALAEGRRLLGLARLLAWRARRPGVLVICGAAATGKTRLAEALAAISGLRHLNSDVVRKELAGLEPDQRAPEREYSDAASLRTYRELGARAAGEREGAVVDATFRSLAHRQAFAESFRAEAVFVECRAPAATVATWAAGRLEDPGRVSDATPAIAAQQPREFDPLDEVPPQQHIVLRTDREPDDLLDQLEAALDARMAPPADHRLRTIT